MRFLPFEPRQNLVPIKAEVLTHLPVRQWVVVPANDVSISRLLIDPTHLHLQQVGYLLGRQNIVRWRGREE